MANCSQLTREYCRKCKEETLHVIDRCNHCGAVRVVVKGPAFEHGRVYRVKRRIPKPTGDYDGSGNHSHSGHYLGRGGISDGSWEG